MTPHDWASDLDWCIRCGRPMYEIMQIGGQPCAGLPGVVHARYLLAQREMMERIGPIIDAVYSEIEWRDEAGGAAVTDERKEPEWTIEAFIAGARWARMAGDKAFDEALLNQDAQYFAETGGNIRCRGDGTVRHFLRTAHNTEHQE